MGSVLDITDRKKAEELARTQEQSLQRTARLVTMGEIASTLAHELNQPLAAIASYGAGCLNLIRSGHAEPAMLTEALEKLGTQAQRAGQIIRRVHDFVRKSEPKIAPTELAPRLAESAAFTEAMAQTSAPDRVLTLAAAMQEDEVVIRVEDRGSGIAETLHGRLFEPFVSTKPDGMGLNICRSIVEMHRGRLSVAARNNGGTVFSLTLPTAVAMEMAS